MSRDRARGFTLIELMAALALVGIIMLGGVLLLDQIGDSAERITRDGARTMAEGNGERLLRRFFADAGTSSDSLEPFRGDERTVEFWSRCDVPGGWTETCRVSLAIDDHTDSSAILARLSTGGHVSLRSQRGSSAFRYYSHASDSTWLTRWSSHVTLPLAVGLVIAADTVVFPVSVAR